MSNSSVTEKQFQHAIQDIPGSITTIRETIMSGNPLLDWMWATIAHIRFNGTPVQQQEIESLMTMRRQNQSSMTNKDPLTNKPLNTVDNPEIIYQRYREKYDRIMGLSDSIMDNKRNITRATAYWTNILPYDSLGFYHDSKSRDETSGLRDQELLARGYVGPFVQESGDPDEIPSTISEELSLEDEIEGSSPMESPTLSPRDSPTLSPSSSPTLSPRDSPTLSPSSSPTLSPSGSPTLSPLNTPMTLPKEFSLEDETDIILPYEPSSSHSIRSPKGSPVSRESRKRKQDHQESEHKWAGEPLNLNHQDPTKTKKRKVKLFGDKDFNTKIEDVDDPIEEVPDFLSREVDFIVKETPEKIEDIEEFESPIRISKKFHKKEPEEEISDFSDEYDSDDIDLDEDPDDISNIRNRALQELKSWSNRDLLQQPDLASKVRRFIQYNFQGMTTPSPRKSPTFDMMTNDQICQLFVQPEFGLSDRPNLKQLCEMTNYVSNVSDLNRVIEETLEGAGLSTWRSVVKDMEDIVDYVDIPTKLLGLDSSHRKLVNKKMLQMLKQIPIKDKMKFKEDLQKSSPVPVVVLKGYGVTSQNERNRAVVYWGESDDAPFVQFRLTN